MNNKIENVKLTKEVYVEVSADITSKITDIREEKDQVTTEISKRIATLKELRRTLKEVKNKIRIEKSALRQNKNRKFALTRKLSAQNRYARNLNRAFSTGEESIDLTRFYTVPEKKAR